MWTKFFVSVDMDSLGAARSSGVSPGAGLWSRGLWAGGPWWTSRQAVQDHGWLNGHCLAVLGTQPTFRARPLRPPGPTPTAYLSKRPRLHWLRHRQLPE